MGRLSERVAVVTGGGSGLGRAVCRVLAEAGAGVVVADVRLQAAEKVAGELPGATARQVDVTDAGSIEALFRALDRVDVLVSSAGIDKTAPIEELTLADYDRIMAVNLRGPFVAAKCAYELMRRQGGGHIVNVISTAGKRAWPNATVYHASKWGLLGLSHALHAEARQHGVKVTAVVPGGMRTPFLLDRFPDIDPGVLQDPHNVAETIRFVLEMPDESVVPEVMVLPMRESSWP